MWNKKQGFTEDGTTLVEVVISLTILAIIALSALALFTSLINSTVVAKQKSIATTLATNQMEYLKSLPYDSLAIQGGTIFATSPLPGTTTQQLNGITYTVTSSINYADDAFDGCGSYPTQELKERYCRNYPPPSGAPAVDNNPQDYKVVNVKVTNPSNSKLAEVDSQIAAKVAETSSTTGALFVTVIDASGNPVQGSSVSVTNSTLTPNVNVTDTTDAFGTAIFYGLPPDTNNFDYVITSSKSGYSSLATIAPSGVLQPTYSSQKIFTQQSSFVTLTIKPIGTYSAIVEAVNQNGTALPNLRVHAKGGYKRYTDVNNTAYYFNNVTPTDSRPTTDASGVTLMDNLTPGEYFFCGDAGATSCTIGGTTYYLLAAIPYGGSSTLNPTNIPVYTFPAESPVFDYNGNSYLQRVRLIFSTNASFPRLSSLAPQAISLSTDTISNFSFTLEGTNLPCNTNPASCSTTVSVIQGANTYPAVCTGDASGVLVNCTVNVSGIGTGSTQISVTSGGNTLTTPGNPLIGGFIVNP